jgi:predicted short-subunit dehydrogenase-like oxidoreductase (DUF2520 family)
MSQPLSGLQYALVGPGRVGRSLIGWMGAAGAELVLVAGRGLPEPSTEAFGGVLTVSELETPQLDLLLLSVPDPALPEVVEALASRPQATVVLHTSGRRGASILAPLRANGSQVGCLHPLRAFPRPLPEPDVASTTFFGLCGDPEAVSLASRLAAAWNAPHGVVPEDARTLYHLSATLAAGGVAAVLTAATTIARASGLPESTLEGYRLLAAGAILALAPTFEARAITGPAARAELGYAEQLGELKHLDPALLPLAVELACATLELLDRELGPDAARAELRQRLREL